MSAPNTDKTERKQSGLIPFEPGKSGNPAGRPKGARSRLGESFIEALLADFKRHGVQSIIDMRDEKPGDYVKVVASLLPKEIDLTAEVETIAKDQRDAAVAAALRADS
jgi:hypothetical protein